MISGRCHRASHYLTAILTNHDLDVAAVFYPSMEDPGKAAIIELGDGEAKSDRDSLSERPRFTFARHVRVQDGSAETLV
jgi:hypothetical protein